jgi:hypothetical protein
VCDSLIPQWAAHFAEILAVPAQTAEADYGLKIVVLQVTGQLPLFGSLQFPVENS